MYKTIAVCRTKVGHYKKYYAFVYYWNMENVVFLMFLDYSSHHPSQLAMLAKSDRSHIPPISERPYVSHAWLI